MTQLKFWKTTPFNQLAIGQWESLRDGCGKCCVRKLEDADTCVVYSTDVSCKLLDCQTAKCLDMLSEKNMPRLVCC